MAILKEWNCRAHGPFEATRAVCPKGCTSVERQIRTAPSIGSTRTKGIDQTIRGLAKSYGLTNLSNRNGAVKGTSATDLKLQAYNEAIHKMFPSVWGTIPKGGTHMVGRGAMGAQPGGGAEAALASLHAQPDNVIARAKEAFVPIAQKTIVRQDHENLKVMP